MCIVKESTNMLFYKQNQIKGSMVVNPFCVQVSSEIC